MARKSFLAQVQRQIAAAQRDAERAQKAAARQHQAAITNAERARKANERAAAQAERATEADRKRLEREAKDAHAAAKQAEVDEMNAGLADLYDQIDSLLSATLEVDDYFALEALRRAVDHPPFDRPDLEARIPPPPDIPEPLEPLYSLPDTPKALFGRKKRQAEAEQAAREAHTAALDAWERDRATLPARRQALADEHAKAEAQRITSLASERERYDRECALREAEVATHNSAVDRLITDLGYGTAEAIEEYASIVLSNSIYPTEFPVLHDLGFDRTSAELRIRTLVPGPDTVPTTKVYKYTKSSDAITTTALSQKACRDRYSEAVQQVALRTLHEVFEADRRGLIKMISLELGTETIHPATGHATYVPFIAVATDRETFLGFDLSAIIPVATLNRLGAAVSKNPYGLVPAGPSGIRST